MKIIVIYSIDLSKNDLRHTQQLLLGYLDVKRESMDKSDEIKVLKEENHLLKKKIEELELQVKYMPGGDGYEEAKDHFQRINK